MPPGSANCSVPSVIPRSALFLGLIALGVPGVGQAQDDEWEDLDEAVEPFEDDAYDPIEDEVAAEEDENRSHETLATESVGQEMASEAHDAQAFRAQPTYLGPIGGIHVPDAASARTDSFRLQLGLEFFDTSDFLIDGDSHNHVGGAFSVTWTPLGFLELWASLRSHADTNDRGDPQLLEVLGDTTLGAKAFYRVAPWLAIGGDLSVGVLNAVSGAGPSLDSTSLGLRLNASADLRQLRSRTPLIARFNVQYVLDNSSELTADVEQARYNALPDPAAELDESRHLITRVERFSLGIDRTDMLRLGLGIEGPFRVGTDIFVHPILEWTLGLPVNRQGFECVRPAESELGSDRCLDLEGLGSFPMTLTPGIRVLPPVRGLAAFVAVDIGLTGTSLDHAVRELAQTPPYRVLFGVSYAFDTRTPPEPEVIVREVERRIEIRQDPPRQGRIRGLVVERGALTPVGNAIVRFPGRDVNPQLADVDGRFVTYTFDPGEVGMDVSRDGYAPGACSAVVPEDAADVDVRCELERGRVQIEETEVQILEQIRFAYDSDVILPDSFGLMEEIGTTLSNHSEILLVEVQGHTDNRGTERYNLSLSQRRAESVRRWLVEHGVSEARLQSQGYGLTQPIASNENPAGRRRMASAGATPYEAKPP